jgi:alcohol dehydrogenase, propanol-preferring
MVLTKTAKVETNLLEFASLDKPIIIRDNELLVEIKASRVCRSNLHLVEDDWNRYSFPVQLPIIPGHEIVHIVKSIGERVKGVKIDARIGIQPLYESCLMYEYCIESHENLYSSIKITGETINSGYAEYISISEDFVILIPDKLDCEHSAPLFCPRVTAYKKM